MVDDEQDEKIFEPVVVVAGVQVQRVKEGDRELCNNNNIQQVCKSPGKELSKKYKR